MCFMAKSQSINQKQCCNKFNTDFKKKEKKYKGKKFFKNYVTVK